MKAPKEQRKGKDKQGGPPVLVIEPEQVGSWVEVGLEKAFMEDWEGTVNGIGGALHALPAILDDGCSNTFESLSGLPAK